MNATRATPTGATAIFMAELSTAGRKLRTVFDGFVRQRGLTLARARALLSISRNPRINQTELAALLEVECPTVVRLLDGMQKQGLIRREPIDGDRRARQLALTDAAAAQLKEIEQITAHIGGAVLRDIPAADIETTIRVLRRVAANLDAFA